MMNRLSNAFARCWLWGFLAASLTVGGARAEVTDLSSSPLTSATATTVLPNLLFVLDDSGSMGWDYMPDNVNDNNTCRKDSGNSTTCQAGEPPYYAAQFNYVFYNPTITYTPGVNADGSSKGSQSAAAAKVDPYTSTSTTDLTANFPEAAFCNGSSVNPNTSPGSCRRNGITGGDASYTTNPFWYSPAQAGAAGSALYGLPDTSSGTYPYIRTRNNNPFFFTIVPREYCSDINLTTCTLSAQSTGGFTYPAPVRYCKSNSTNGGSADTAVVTGSTAGSARCQAKYSSTYKYPRYGVFLRTDIVSTTTTYGNATVTCTGGTLRDSAGTALPGNVSCASTVTAIDRSTRTDCAAAPTCTYAEEVANFANWYSYYRNRIQMMKTAAGRAFVPIDDKYRVGFVTINAGSPVSSSKYLAISKFDATQKSNWYTKFYAAQPSGSTPLREALSRAGRYFSHKTDGINAGMSDDPMQYSCQQNFTLLTTDGYWNGNAGQKLDGSAMDNQDNADSGYSTRASGAYDGAVSGATGTLADVALYYYKTDLRSAGSTGALGVDVATDNVPTSSKDSNSQQHMVTFTLGLGLDGLMNYRTDYETATAGDLYSIKTAATACSFSGAGTCNWPLPAADTATALDDLWHAAVNGRGKYFSAKNPNDLTDGLGNALAGVNAQTGAAAASATSSPNITQTDNYIYSTTYRTVKWDGEVVAQQIDITTGDVLAPIIWSAQSLLDAKTSSATDTRTIYTFDSVATNKLKAFQWANLSAAEKAHFSNKCVSPAQLSQCATLSTAQQTLANSGQNLLEYLRGQTQYEGTSYRDRDHVLGDAVNATPAYVKKPPNAFGDQATPDYTTFQATNASRTPVLYIAANDGMLHAFNGGTGAELWSYVPTMLMPTLYKLADENYATGHTYYVDGSPSVMDAYIGGSVGVDTNGVPTYSGGAWKTMLVGGLNAGGRGFYAMDVTDPANPKGMWEICSDSTLCTNYDTDIGYSYGNPIITKRASDGKWVVLVTSGYNNVSPGTGKGFLFVLDAATGSVLQKIDTGAGTTSTPSGLSKISAWADNFNNNNTSKRVYGGDLQGNVWRFDLTTATATVMSIAQLKDSGGKAQSVTTRPELGYVSGNPVLFIGTGRYLGVTDLSDPATLSPALPYAYQQSLYAFKDTATNYGSIRGGTGGVMVQQTLSQPSATTRTATANPVDWAVNKGWYVDFDPGSNSPGERVNIDPQLVLGTLLVATNVPNANACNIGGDSWLYQFDYDSGSFVASSPNQVVANKIANTLTVGLVIVRLPSGQMKGVATGASGVKTTFGVNTGGGSNTGRRVSWREITNSQ